MRRGRRLRERLGGTRTRRRRRSRRRARIVKPIYSFCSPGLMTGELSTRSGSVAAILADCIAHHPLSSVWQSRLWQQCNLLVAALDRGRPTLKLRARAGREPGCLSRQFPHQQLALCRLAWLASMFRLKTLTGFDSIPADAINQHAPVPQCTSWQGRVTAASRSCAI